MTTTVSVPEHVDATTYSPAGTSEPPLEEDGTDITVSSAPDFPEEISVVITADEIPEEKLEENSVPQAVKTVVSLLVVSVVLVIFYIFITDYVNSKKRAK